MKEASNRNTEGVLGKLLAKLNFLERIRKTDRCASATLLLSLKVVYLFLYELKNTPCTLMHLVQLCKFFIATTENTARRFELIAAAELVMCL